MTKNPELVIDGARVDNIEYLGDTENGHVCHVWGVKQDGIKNFFESMEYQNAALAHPADVVTLRCEAAEKLLKENKGKSERLQCRDFFVVKKC